MDCNPRLNTKDEKQTPAQFILSFFLSNSALKRECLTLLLSCLLHQEELSYLRRWAQINPSSLEWFLARCLVTVMAKNNAHILELSMSVHAYVEIEHELEF